MYPKTEEAPNRKLRLMYECNALAFISEQAGGLTTNGNTRIMELELTELHQRSPLFMGSKKIVEKAHSFRN